MIRLNLVVEVESLRRIRDEFPSPEEIDDADPPSKRIKATFPSYDKRADGPILAFEIGLEAIRRECAHFHEWLATLEELGRRA